MSHHFRCPQGHHWEVPLTCPHCGAPVTATSSPELPPAETTTVPPIPVPAVATASGTSYAEDFPTIPPTSTAAVDGPRAHPGPVVPGYEVLGELGRGGMGVVYKARQIGLNRVVALKMILAGGHAGQAELARFRLEAEAVARLQHPNIVQVFEIGEAHGHPFFSLELVEGGTLAERLGHRPQPARQAAELTATLARAVHAAHEAGIVHRDLKPANVLLAVGNVPKITDFGLAKRLDAESALTQSNAVLGTPSYMAPEQAEGTGKAVGPPTDVYALGAILYEMLTGRPPFLAETPLDTILQVVADEPAPPSRLQSKVPPDLEAVCLKCLRKEPRRRYRSALALAEDLERFLDGAPTEARLHGSLPWARRHARQMAAIGVWSLAVAVVVGLILASTFLPDRKAGGPYLLVGFGVSVLVLLGSWRLGLSLWRRSAHRSLDVLSGHLGPVYGVAFSPDGERLASASGDGTVRLWEAATAKVWATLSGHRGKVYAVAFSPDGETLASAGADGTVRLWGTATGEERGRLAASPPTEAGLRGPLSWFGRNGGLFAGLAGGALAALTLPLLLLGTGAGGQPLLYLSLFLFFVVLPIVLLSTWRVLRPGLWMGGRSVHALAFSPDGRTIAAGSADGAVALWDVCTGQPQATLWLGVRQLPAVHALAFCPDGGALVVGHANGVCNLWGLDDRNAREVQSMGRSGAVAVSPDGQQLAAGADLTSPRNRHVCLFNAITGQPLGSLNDSDWLLTDLPWPGNMRPWALQALAFSSDNKLLGAALGRAVVLWEVDTGKVRHRFTGHRRKVHAVAFSPDGHTLASGSADRTIRLWDPTAPARSKQRSGPNRTTRTRKEAET